MIMRITENFNLDEFHCKDGTTVPEELIGNVIELAGNLQVLRDHIKSPIFINSGYRSPAYNAKVGGVKSSQHLLAKAADITTKNHTPKQLYDIIEFLIIDGKMKEGGLGLYPGFVHYDVRGEKARW